MWLGLESDEKKWGQVDQEGEVAVYAETYENQVIMGAWSNSGCGLVKLRLVGNDFCNIYVNWLSV